MKNKENRRQLRKIESAGKENAGKGLASMQPTTGVYPRGTGSNPVEGNGHCFPSYRRLYLSSFSDTHTHTHTHTHTQTRRACVRANCHVGQRANACRNVCESVCGRGENFSFPELTSSFFCLYSSRVRACVTQ